MIFQDPSTDPRQLTDDVRRVMERPEFRYDPSWFDRLGDWINRQLERVFGQGDTGPATGGANFGGGAGSLIAWLIILVAVALVIGAIAYVLVNRVSKVDADDGPATDIEIEHRRRAKEWATDAERHEAAGEWKEALRDRYRELVRTLVDRRQVPDVVGRTTGELRPDLAVTTPDASEAFDTASLLFELAWYAHVATGEQQNSEFRAAAGVVLAAPIVASTEAPPVGPATVEVSA